MNHPEASDLSNDETGRGNVPPGAGLLIALGVSIVFWGGIALAFF